MSHPQPFTQALPDSFPVRILMCRQPVTDNPWIDHRWQVLGVTAGDSGGEDPAGDQHVERDGVLEVLIHGHRVTLYQDECESYYHNLIAPKPNCYVITRTEEDGMPRPFQVSMSFDEANAYLETDDVEVFPVPMPPELYRWTEAYVLAHYVPEPRRKRKRDDWRREPGH